MASPSDEDAARLHQLFMMAVHSNDVSVTTDVLTTASVDVDCVMDNGKTPLVEAIANGNIDLINVLLEHNANVLKPCPGVVQACWGDIGPTSLLVYPLQQALKGRDGCIVQRLLEVGADLHEAGFSVIEVCQIAIKRLQNTSNLIELLLAKLEEDSVSVSKYKNQLCALLVTAVLKRNAELVRVVLNKGANPNHRLHVNDLPVLVLAANERDLDVCHILVEAGAVLNNLSYIEDVRPLTSAVEADLVDAVATLIQLGAEVNLCSHLHAQKVTLLHMAVARRNLAVVKLLLDAGAYITAMGNQHLTPLHILCEDVQVSDELASLLLSKIDDDSEVLEVKDTRGQSALLVAARNKNIECVRQLIAKGASVNSVDINGDSVLQHAVRMGSDICVDLLVSSGANVNSGRTIGCTPLLSAIWLGDYTLVDLLLEAGADALATKQGNRETGLHLSIAAQSDDILELLLTGGRVPIDQRTESGDTPLMLAARSSSERTCRLLVEHGATLDLTDANQEETALSLSIYFGKEDNACLLIREGADVNIADHTHLTPIYWAFFNCRVQALVLLVFAGAALTLQDLSQTYPCNLSVMHNQALIGWIRAFLGRPRTLQDLCRLRIRQAARCVVAGRRIGGLVRDLPLPDKLKDFVMYLDDKQLPDFTVPTESRPRHDVTTELIARGRYM